MYCKFCGKEIDADSCFCKHCGAKLNDGHIASNSVKRNGNIIKWFLGLSKSLQIFIMSYFLWLSGWLCWLLFCLNADSHRYPKEENIVLSIICVIILPAAAVFIWHYYAHLRTPNETNSSLSDNGPGMSTLTATGTAHHKDQMDHELKIYKVHSLIGFAKEHGKMQRMREYDAKTCSYLVFFVFTDKGGNSITVQSSNETKDLSSEQISAQKYALCVNEFSDGHYQLSYREQSNESNEDYKPKD